MRIIASDLRRLISTDKRSGSRFEDDFYGRFSDLDLDSVDEVRKV